MIHLAHAHRTCPHQVVQRPRVVGVVRVGLVVRSQHHPVGPRVVDRPLEPWFLSMVFTIQSPYIPIL